MLEKKIRRQVLIPLTLTFLLLVTAFLFTSYRIRVEDYASDLGRHYQQVQKVLGSLIADRIQSMTSVVEFIADQERFQAAMRQKDRAALFQHGSALLERLFSRQQITHFYFYDKNGNMVLRVYQPENMTESSPRFTKQQAMTKGTPVSGLELGKVGTFTLRVVYPWKINNELIGYIELGQEIDSLLRELATITEINFLVFIDKSYLDRAAWEEGMRLLGRWADWDLFPGKVLIDQTVAMPASAVAKLIAADSVHEKYGSTVEADGRSYRAGSFPLVDAAKRTVGEFVMLQDMTDQIRSFKLFGAQVVGFSILLSGGLFVFSFRVLGQVDRQLQETRERLRQELENQALTNRKLEVEIAERRRAEESLIGLNEHLEQRVLDRTSELNKLNREIEAGRTALEVAYRDLQAKQATILQQDKMACIGQLAAGVAHDINNPIGFVTGNLEVLRNYGSKILKYVKVQADALRDAATTQQLASVEEARRTLKIDRISDDFEAVTAEALEGADRVKRIVLNLTGFSRINEADARLADIHECLESTIVIVGNELRHKAVVKRDYGEIPALYCHPQQLNQVFMNLLINASHAIDRWGTISIRTWTDGNSVFIAIGDTGCGISPDSLPRIFEPFFTTKESGIGTGLGLSIVHDIIMKHGGEIAVESELSKGAVFTIRLPLRGPASETDHA
jgi:signal transduction histidine kinase